MSALGPSTAAPGARLVPLVFLPAALALVLTVVLRRLTPPEPLVDPLAFAAGGGLVVASLSALVFTPPPLPASGMAALASLAGAALAGPSVSWVLVDTGLLLGAAALGRSLGRRVAHPGHVLAASAMAAAADLVSLSTPDLPSYAIAHSERALGWLMIFAPVPGSSAIAPVLGVGDLVFASLILAAGEAHAVSRRLLVGSTVLGLASAGAASALLHQPVPALVALGAAYVGCVPAFRAVRRADRSATAAAIAALVVASAWASLHQGAPGAQPPAPSAALTSTERRRPPSPERTPTSR